MKKSYEFIAIAMTIWVALMFGLVPTASETFLIVVFSFFILIAKED